MRLESPVTQIPLIGPSYQKLLDKLEIKTIGDLLYHFPYRYNDFSRQATTASLIAGEVATVTGKIASIKNIYTHSGKNFVQATLEDASGEILLVWFNQPFITRILHPGDLVTVSGILGSFGSKPALISPEYELSPETGETIHVGRLVPIYSETAGLSSKWLRSRINTVLKNNTGFPETLPKKILATENYPARESALEQIHFPKTLQEADRARKRFAFEELFDLSLKGLLRKRRWQQEQSSNKLRIKQPMVDKFITSLPFQLTGAQKRLITEITSDLEQSKPMNRLLEGDVGSGKTVVAAIAAYVTALNNLQTLYMAPTEILAKQHFETFKLMFSKYEINIELVTGSQKNDRRQRPFASLSTNSKDEKRTFASLSTNSRDENCNKSIFIGTHALLYHSDFKEVGLVIIDEQHRFGVEQRAELLKKCSGGLVPHLLTISATPIPRSLQLILLGDLDLSVIDEMPVGRKPVKTWVVPKNKRANAYEWLKKLKTQAFIVCPFIEESEVETLVAVRAAKKEFSSLQVLLAPLKLGLLHGKLKPAEKDNIVESFRQGKIDVLVSTPVVEVGVDIPRASVMIVEGAERFGLASLHQLRGRVGRAGQQAYCLLFTTSETGNVSRLKALENNYDGADLAEIDLKYRGGGDIFGTMQHGLSAFKVADPGDTKLVKKARDWAAKVIASPEKYPEIKSKTDKINLELVEPN